MPVQFTLLMIPFVVSALLSAGLAVYAVRELRESGRDGTVLAFLGIVLSALIWTLSRTFQWLFVSESLTHVFLTGVYVGYGGAAMSLFFFAIAYTGRREWLTPRRVGLVLVAPVAAVVLASTNETHGLLWSGEFVTRNGLLILEREFEPLFYLYFCYALAFMLAGIYYLLRMAVESPEIYRRQAVAFLVGSLTPIVFGTLFAFELTPLVPEFVDLTPIGFAVTGLCYGYAVFRYQMLDLVPVARDTVIESMRDGYIVLDDKNRIVDLNSAAMEVLDERDDVVGESLDAVLPASEQFVTDHEHGTQAEAELEIEVGGEQRFFVANVSSLHDGDRLIGRLLLIRDITERRSVQKRYQALIENSSDLIIVTDSKGTITYASPSIRNIIGVDPEFVLDRSPFEFIHKDDQEAVREDFSALQENPGEKRRTEYRVRTESGDWIYMESEIWNLLDNPFVEGIVTNAREITERKEREREIQEANRQLSEKNEQLDQFASVISHDLRNPINVAKGHAQLARETGNEESFEKIEDSLDRMEDIIDDVLTLAREGESIGETREVTLGSITAEAWGHVATDAATLVVDRDCTFEADPDRLLQLFENCFRNAHEHVGEDVTVTVGCGDGILYVEDDGPGIDPDRREEIFEPGETTNPGGTGLGLSIVSQIADAHGWSVRVTDGSNGGARFEFEGVQQLQPVE